MARQPTHFHASSAGDLVLAGQYDPTTGQVLNEHLGEISDYILGQSINTAVLSNAMWYHEIFGAENGYHCQSLVTDRAPLITVTGAINHLDRICISAQSPPDE